MCLAQSDFYRLKCRPQNNISWHLSQFNILFSLVQVSAADEHMNGLFFYLMRENISVGLTQKYIFA